MSNASQANNWAKDEFGEARLGDIRLTQRLIAIAHQLSQSPECSLPKSLDNYAELKAAYRFFDNPKVDPDGILKPHLERTLGRLRQVSVVLAVQDTTEFNLNHLPATEGLGYGSHSDVRGFLMHSTLAVTSEGLPLGILGLRTWIRPLEELGKRQSRRQRGVDDKESGKWLESIHHLSAVKTYCPDAHLVSVCDREGDLYDLFMAERPAGVDWLVRASQNRRVAHPEHALWETMATAPVLGETPLPISGSNRTQARTARLELRCCPIRLHPPRSRYAEGLQDVDVYAVQALEVEAPEGVEPLEWMLLTSVPTSTYDQAQERLAWYSRRWTIESWHRILKSGCRIESRQLGHFDRFIRATALFAVIAWRIQYATLLGRLDNDLSCETLLQPIEWRALYCRTHQTTRPPDTAPSLNQAVLWIAKLGGYLGRKHDRPPGPTVMWRGFFALHEIVGMYRIFSQNK